MKTRFTVTCCVALLACQICFAEEAKTTASRTIDLHFQKATALAVAEWIPRLTGRPLIVPADLNFQVTFSTQKVDAVEALHVVEGILHKNGCELTKTEESYDRIIRPAQTDWVPNLPHIDVKLQNNKVVIGGVPVEPTEVAKTLAKIANPDTEIWVAHPVGPPAQIVNNEGLQLLLTAPALNATKYFLKYLPRDA